MINHFEFWEAFAWKLPNCVLQKQESICTLLWYPRVGGGGWKRLFWGCKLSHLTLSQPRGHIVPPPPPPQVHFLKHLRKALSYGLETFWQFKWIKLKNKNLFFNRLRPPLVTIATFKVDACFWKAHFGSFHAKAYQNSMFFATPMKNGRTVVCCEILG